MKARNLISRRIPDLPHKHRCVGYSTGIVKKGDWVKIDSFHCWERAQGLIGKLIEDYPQYVACRPLDRYESPSNN